MRFVFLLSSVLVTGCYVYAPVTVNSSPESPYKVDMQDSGYSGLRIADQLMDLPTGTNVEE